MAKRIIRSQPKGAQGAAGMLPRDGGTEARHPQTVCEEEEHTGPGAHASGFRPHGPQSFITEQGSQDQASVHDGPT